jgi:hypothetical protein
MLMRKICMMITSNTLTAITTIQTLKAIKAIKAITAIITHLPLNSVHFFSP